MEPEGSLPQSQQPASFPCSDRDQSSPCSPPPPPFMKIHFNIILQSIPRYSKWSLSFGLPHQNPISTFATCTAHLIHLYLIIRIAFGEEYILLSTLISNMVSHRFSLNVSGINSDPKFKIFITALAGSSKQHYMTKQR
jgi:hypothetical protein